VVKNGEQAVGNKTRVEVVKNKVAPPFRECEFEITYGTGIFAVGEIVDLASEAGLIEKSGAYYSLNGERIAQGRDKACQFGVHDKLGCDALCECAALTGIYCSATL
jgi:recombination protein RecA